MFELKLVSGEHLKLIIEGAHESSREPRTIETERTQEIRRIVDVGDQLDPGHLSHMFAVLAMLRPEETQLACEVAAGFGPGELRAWLGELMTLSAMQAVQHVRVLIAGNTEAVS